MMNETQERKALIALSKEVEKKAEKNRRIKRHFDAVEAVTKYNLPYKVFFKTDFSDDEIPINQFYPYPAVPLSGKWEWFHSFATKADFLNAITEHTGKYDSEGKEFCYVGIDSSDDVQRMKEEHEKQYAPWNLETKEGVKQWERYFTRFLLPFEKDMVNWTAFDFFGTEEHTEEEADQKRQYYLSLIKDCKEHPDNYELTAPKKKAEDITQFDVGIFYLNDLPEEQTNKDMSSFLMAISELNSWMSENNIRY